MIEVLDQTTPDAAVILAQHAVSMRRLLPGRLAKRGNGKAPSLPSDISRLRPTSTRNETGTAKDDYDAPTKWSGLSRCALHLFRA